ncbi:LysE family translocator [Enterovibrio norvegicus]|uniref:Lysine transporter LysE n=1 Tax=Enterovibrio norvegicus TaxID=188144 RepID=A0A2N7L8N9_9GAMM|nr:LysE family translocator [Enterovibrio norvegicus]PMN90668.1 lysine transporter LysE [Enterovibrio norvegicus]
MSDFNFWLLFLASAFALNVAPGPDLLYILTKTIRNGKKVGLASALGVCTGALFHVFAAAFGLSMILASSALAFSLVKYIGAAYLFYLAYQALQSSGFELIVESSNQRETAFESFKQGVIIDILNPKVAIFFMAFLPQFVRENSGPVSFQLIYLGLLVIAVAIVVETAYVLVADKISERIRSSKRLSIWLDRAVGAMFVTLGIKLVLSTN